MKYRIVMLCIMSTLSTFSMEYQESVSKDEKAEDTRLTILNEMWEEDPDYKKPDYQGPFRGERINIGQYLFLKNTLEHGQSLTPEQHAFLETHKDKSLPWVLNTTTKPIFDSLPCKAFVHIFKKRKNKWRVKRLRSLPKKLKRKEIMP